MVRRMLAAGNWKMNGLAASAAAELGAVAAAAKGGACDVLIFPPATLIAALAQQATGTGVAIGGQDCHAAISGAHTGDISAGMIADAGGVAVIVGHSERRADHGESDQNICAKAEAAWRAELIAVICIGETESQRDARNTLDIIGVQMANSIPDGASAASLVVAYEPVWAIGTGRTPTLEDIAEVHDFMRMRLTRRFGAEVGDGVRLLYGGSVKPGNAAEIFAIGNVDGGLVGGASLKAVDFSPIIAAAS